MKTYITFDKILIFTGITMLFICCEKEVDLTKFKEYDWSKVQEIEFAKIPAGYFRNLKAGIGNGIYNYGISATFKLDNYEISKKKITVGQFCMFLNAIKPEISKYHDGYEILKYNGKYLAYTEKFWHGEYLHVDQAGGIFIPEPDFENVVAKSISWDGAYEFCKWAGFRLPSVKEWEYAANNRKPDDYDFLIWSRENLKTQKSWEIEDLIKVNTLFQNSYGLNDILLQPYEWVAGNVEEQGWIDLDFFYPKDTIFHMDLYKRGNYKIVKYGFFDGIRFNLYNGVGQGSFEEDHSTASFRVCK